MEENIENHYVNRSQKDYSISLKLQVVYEEERGELLAYSAQRKDEIQGKRTVIRWLKKFNN